MKQDASKQTQKEKFIAAAQELGGTEKAFNAALKRIGKAKSKPPSKKKPK